MRPVIMMLAWILAAAAHAAPACHAVSGDVVTPLVELYTSEGCDSCPPAERWLSSRFDAAPGVPHAIALAFHVDYWDRLGWVDRFADHRYTERQYDAMRANAGTFVYTPQVLLQGRDFAWSRDDAAALSHASRTGPGAVITIEASPGGRDVAVHVQARIADRSAADDAELFVAYVDSGLVSDVSAGENRGVRLTHDHVVRMLRLASRRDSDGHLGATMTLERPAESGVHPMLVAFVERRSDRSVLQALALPLDDCDAHPAR